MALLSRVFFVFPRFLCNRAAPGQHAQNDRHRGGEGARGRAGSRLHAEPCDRVTLPPAPVRPPPPRARRRSCMSRRWRASAAARRSRARRAAPGRGRAPQRCSSSTQPRPRSAGGSCACAVSRLAQHTLFPISSRDSEVPLPVRGRLDQHCAPPRSCAGHQHGARYRLVSARVRHGRPVLWQGMDRAVLAEASGRAVDILERFCEGHEVRRRDCRRFRGQEVRGREGGGRVGSARIAGA